MATHYPIKNFPGLDVHASTQMSIHSLDGARAAADMGLTRAVLARELSLEQIKYISKNSPIETEIFVHGALCVACSGQCLMSSMIGGRSGNRGCCGQPCRSSYDLYNKKGKCLRKNEHLLSLKDFNASKQLENMIDAGITSFKIEISFL